jgi:hypothetical protein
MVKKIIIILVFALIGWGLCGAIIGIGRSVTSMDNTLIIHAVGAPIIFAGLSWLYYARFHFTSPLQTAAIFLGVVILMDAGVIAPFAEKSYAMFTSILGTWIPFALIFFSTLLVGLIMTRKTRV